MIWRLAKDILPTKANLCKKGIQLDPCCPFCKCANETAHHLFMDCFFAKQVLFSSTLSYRTPQNLDIHDWISSFLLCGDSFCLQIMCWTIYGIWNARNMLLYQQKETDPMVVAGKALDAVLEFNKWNPEIAVSKKILAPPVEISHCQDTMVANVDAGVFRGGVVSYGCVLQNHHGEFALAACHRESINVEPVIDEIAAIRWCLLLALELQVHKIIIQSDCLNVVDCINGVTKVASLEPIAMDCRMFCSRFKFASVVFINRDFNHVAHKLVGFGKIVGSRTWVDELPSMKALDVVSSAFSH